MNTQPLARLTTLIAVTCALAWAGPLPAAETLEAEIAVFGGTSGGIAAAVQASRMGRKVVLLEPGRYLGGLTTGGLGATDIGNKAAIGGLAREFYQRIARHYARDEAWTLETRADYFARRRGSQTAATDLSATNATMWTFEPHVADLVYADLLREAKVPVLRNWRLAGARKDGTRLVAITSAAGNTCRAAMFIDATYEGDLMAAAKVSFHVGREANATYGETLNGIRASTPKHQFTVPVDPYVKPGDPASGLLPLIQPGDGGRPGDGDHRVQAYNYRLCYTTNALNRLPHVAPPGYDPARYELLARYLEARLAARQTPRLDDFWHPIWMPNHKTDINNNGGFSTDFIGANYDYPAADYATRERLDREHEQYVRGFVYFLATSPRVPENIRRDMARWGPAQDEFRDTAGWPRQLYVREARRLVGELVMTEHHCRGKEKVSDPVGLAAYAMDSHNVQRIVKNGRVENEGDVQVPPMSPYPISYRALVPKAAECNNLLVPVCLSASHIAYGSIRMEPVFMILGQSAATAASLALAAQVPLQQVDYAQLRARLLADGQVLAWQAPAAGTRSGRPADVAVITPRSLPGTVLDDADGVRTGDWTEGSVPGARRVGVGYLHDNNAHKGGATIAWTPDLPAAGRYEILILAPPHPNRASRVPVTVAIQGAAPRTFHINQRSTTEGGFFSLGEFQLPAGRTTTVTLGNAGTDGYVVADGVQFLPVEK